MQHCVRSTRLQSKLAPVSDSPAQWPTLLSFPHTSIAGEASEERSENELLTLSMDGLTVRGQEDIRSVSTYELRVEVHGIDIHFIIIRNSYSS